MMRKILVLLILLINGFIFGQKNDSCRWITYPGESGMDYGVYHFRKSFDLSSIPEHLIIHVSADNRYRLFVNGKAVCFGPARDDLNNWRYESPDIATYLQRGKNTIAALVWNYGKDKPQGQFTIRMGFYCKSESLADINSNSSWKVYKNPSCHVKPVVNMVDVRGGYLAAPTDSVDGRLYPWGWENIAFDDNKWTAASEIKDASGWKLRSRAIPFMEEKKERVYRMIYSKGAVLPERPFKETQPVIIPKNTKTEILLDMNFETIGFPELIVSKGKNAVIHLKYAEALYLKNQKDAHGKFIGEAQYKGNRNETKDKEFVGPADAFIADGAENQLYRPLWFHVFRYVLMEVETKDEPLTINDYYNVFTAYPLDIKASFKCSDEDLNQLWNMGCRTIRVASNETYMDGYYEQLQYIGDARIESLVAMSLSGDARLSRNAIDQLSHSINAEGLTLCAYPAGMGCIIPPFSLFWICMIRDYTWLNNDAAFAKQYLAQIKGIIDWHLKYMDAQTGMLGKMPYWHFVDWPKPWEWDIKKGTGGIPSGAAEGKSSILNLQFAYALQNTIEILTATGETKDVEKYKPIIDRINKNVTEKFWDKNKKMYSDNIEKTNFSQHANCIAVLSGAIQDADATDLMNRIISDTSLIKCTVYYGFFLNRALHQAGLGEQLQTTLGPWKDMANLGLTTFAEKQEPTRSDCHGWSTSINYEFISTILGINPGEQGFKTVYINPHLGNLEWAEGVYPHAKGLIKVSYHKKVKGLSVQIELPAGLQGKFEWQGRTLDLHEGMNKKEMN